MALLWLIFHQSSLSPILFFFNSVYVLIPELCVKLYIVIAIWSAANGLLLTILLYFFQLTYLGYAMRACGIQWACTRRPGLVQGRKCRTNGGDEELIQETDGFQVNQWQVDWIIRHLFIVWPVALGGPLPNPTTHAHVPVVDLNSWTN